MPGHIIAGVTLTLGGAFFAGAALKLSQDRTVYAVMGALWAAGALLSFAAETRAVSLLIWMLAAVMAAATVHFFLRSRRLDQRPAALHARGRP